jgi:Cyclic nucleotide-binding domain
VINASGSNLRTRGVTGALMLDRSLGEPATVFGDRALRPAQTEVRLPRAPSKGLREATRDDILLRSGTFQGVEPSAVSALTEQLQSFDFGRGRTVFAEGEPGDRAYIIMSGKVKFCSWTPDGRANLASILCPSDMFGELYIFDKRPRTSSATTITEVRAVSMDITDTLRMRRAM